MPTAHLSARAARAAGVACRHCGAAEFTTAWQTFSDGTKHIRMDCARCGAFARWVSQKDRRSRATSRHPPPAASRSLAPR
jgi:hypothetical protein